jgi:hypothetical protein
LLTLRNVLCGSVVDMGNHGNSNLLVTTWGIGDMAMGGVLLWSSAVSGKMASTTTVEADGAGGGSSSQWCRQVQHRRWWW